ncbi:PEP-CTERM sorting domain-containing protein [Candidatus Nitrospira salsa]
MKNANSIVMTLCVFLLILSETNSSYAMTMFGNTGLSGGFRWDADSRHVHDLERSLSGGLRYSLQTGSYAGYRDLFSWQGEPPSVTDFQHAIEDAFAAWTVDDPVSGLGSDLSFVADLETPAVGTGFGRVNIAGAEIDLLAATDSVLWDQGDFGQRGETFFNAVGGGVTLTSGTISYNGGAISGADITINNNPQAAYSLDFFQLLLTHEIGHSVGLGDVEFTLNPGVFIDDNFDGRSSVTALNTLTNSWAGLVDPFAPSASPLSLFDVPDADPGIDTPGVNILMESAIPDVFIGNPTPLQNDDFGGRQFLYPFVSSTVIPEPSTILLFATGLIGLFVYRWNWRS